jgi:hypothetical protein
MGIGSFFKKLFSSEEQEEKELDAARARHGIVLDAKDKAAMDKPTTEQERFAADYDPWEEIKHMRSSFFVGGWAAKKFHIVGEDKVKRDLEALERKRAETSKKRDETAEKQDWEKWRDDKDKKGEG